MLYEQSYHECCDTTDETMLSIIFCKTRDHSCLDNVLKAVTEES